MTEPTEAAPAAAGSSSGGGAAAKVIAPLATFAASWVVRKAMESVYHRRTGHEPPKANDPDASMRQVIVWAVATAAALAVVNVVVDRLASRPKG